MEEFLKIMMIPKGMDDKLIMQVIMLLLVVEVKVRL